MSGINEKDLRNIEINGRDLYNCLNKKESEEYFREEVKGKTIYRKITGQYKTKADPNSKVRRWTRREICMYEELKDYKTTTELVLMLLKLDGEVSAGSAREALKDHPLKPGSRGIAQAIGRLYQRLEPILKKRRKGRETFYIFKDDKYRIIDLPDLYDVYLQKESLEHLAIRLDLVLNEEVPDQLTLGEKVDILNERYKKVGESLNRTEKMLEVIMNHQHITQMQKGRSQRHDVHFYIHFGKED